MELTTGQKLRELRKASNKTIEKVAEELGISYQAMQSYESDTRSPRDHIKIKIAKYYNTTIGAIFFNEQ